MYSVNKDLWDRSMTAGAVGMPSATDAAVARPSLPSDGDKPTAACALIDASGLGPGVHPPEVAIDPGRFFADLAKRTGSVEVAVEVS